MIVRNGLVTNSSSTSYIIISKKELTPEGMVKLLGVKENSKLYIPILKLCAKMLNDYNDGFYHYNLEDTDENLVKQLFGEETAKLFKNAVNNNEFIYCGKLSTDEDQLEVTLCLDCFCQTKKDIVFDISEWGY